MPAKMILPLILGMLMLSLFSSCTIKLSGELVPVQGRGQPVQFTCKGKPYKGGDCVASFGDVQLSGDYVVVDSGRDLSAYFISTPSGPVTALGLARTGTPRGVGLFTGPQGIRFICAFEGERSGSATCTDNAGTMYWGLWKLN